MLIYKIQMELLEWNLSETYFNNSDTLSYTVKQNGSYKLELTATTPITYPTETDFVGSGCPSQLSCSLNLSNQVFSAGVRNANYSTSGNTNYTSNSTTFAVTINQNTSTLMYGYINHSRSNISIYNDTKLWLNATVFNATGIVRIIKNGTVINTGTSPISNYTDFNATGIYNMTFIFDETINYSGSFETWFINVTETPADTPPTYSTNSTNGTTVDTSILHNLNWLDDIGLSGYIFSFCNGSWNGTNCLERGGGDAPANWSDTDYTYRNCFDVTENSGNALTNFQVNFTLDTATLIGASKMRADCNDIRFYNNSGDTLLPHWFKDDCNSATTKLVFQTDLAANEVQEVCVYYGNDGATDARSGNAVFELYDDFSGDLSNWTIDPENTDTVYTHFGRLRQDPDDTQTKNNYDDTRLVSVDSFDNITLEYDIYLAGSGARKIHMVGSRASGNNFLSGYAFRLQNSATDGGYFELATGSWSAIGTSYGTVAENTWLNMTQFYLGSNFETFLNGNSIKTVTDTTTTSGKIVIHMHGVSLVNSTDYSLMDNVRVSQLIANMPTYALDGEMNQTGAAGDTWENDTWVAMEGTSNTSTATKHINATVGVKYAWCFYANDTSNNWNLSTCDAPFWYSSTSAVSDTCTCPGDGNNWEINMEDNCTLSTDCNLGTGNISWIGSHGYFNLSANLNLTIRDAPPSGTIFYFDIDAKITHLIILLLISFGISVPDGCVYQINSREVG